MSMTNDILAEAYPLTLKDENVLFTDPKSERLPEANPIIYGSAGSGKAYSLKEIRDKLKKEGIEKFILDEEKREEYEKIIAASGLGGVKISI